MVEVRGGLADAQDKLPRFRLDTIGGGAKSGFKLGAPHHSYFSDGAFDPRIEFSPALVQLLAELDTWPEPQAGHHYDGLSGLYLLWRLAMARGRYAGGQGFQSIARRPTAGAANSGLTPGGGDGPIIVSRRMF